MNYPREFFSLNYAFARRAAQLGKCSLAEALLRYTHLYMALGLGSSFDPGAQDWQGFLAGLADTEDPAGWMYAASRRVDKTKIDGLSEQTFGCFSYSLWEGGRARLHFLNPGRQSPLRAAFVGERKAELKEMFAYIQAHEPEARSVVGGSWLYHIEAYRRLFPPGYLATARPEEPVEPRFLSLWGQFLSYRGRIKKDTAQRFLAAVERATSLDELLRAFPYPVLLLECPLEVFYRAYRLSAKAKAD